MKKIIFDFNRTLYQPELGQLVPKTKIVLAQLIQRGYSLVLVARAAPGRKNLIKRLGITPFFSKIITTTNKSQALFKRLAKGELQFCTVVGDRVRKEIAIGNDLHMRTIWLRRGMFSNERPRNKQEAPSKIIYRLSSLLKLLP